MTKGRTKKTTAVTGKVRAPSRETLTTTQGEIVIRAMTRGEAVELRNLARGNSADLTEEESDELERKISAIQEKCVVEGAEKLNDIEAGEYIEIIHAIGDLSREYKSKN